MSETLTITRNVEGLFTTFTGTHVCDKMGQDEALFVVAQWIMGKPESELRYGTRIESYHTMRKRIQDEIENKMRPCDRPLITP